MRNMYLQVVFVALLFTFSSASATWLGDGEAIGSTNFGIHKVVTAGSISGMKWLDANGNATRDSDEPGLPGVTIYLDLNRNGNLDSGEPLTVTMADDPATAANEAGRFWFSGLETGIYSVREVVPDGFVQTFPSAAFHEVSLLTGEIVEGIDFGNQPEQSASIHGLKWLDANGNATRDADEPGLPGVTIYLDLNNNGNLDSGEPLTVTIRDDPATAANETGLFWFTRLKPGTYTVREVVPDGFVQTFPSARQHIVVLSPGTILDGLDFGNRRREQ